MEGGQNVERRLQRRRPPVGELSGPSLSLGIGREILKFRAVSSRPIRNDNDTEGERPVPGFQHLNEVVTRRQREVAIVTAEILDSPHRPPINKDKRSTRLNIDLQATHWTLNS